jgi:hypothetical protein
MLTMTRRKTIVLCLISWALFACGCSSLVGLASPRFDPWRFLGLQDSLLSVAGQVCGGAVTLVAGFLAFLSTVAVVVGAAIPEAAGTAGPNEEDSSSSAQEERP